ncbi:TIGR02677 family protein [Verrucomicrobium sp. BvORR034]|uniref:TIGR02677 family protein n=1 Tax=Verrucomicrobium sp. BvORR034 TaxID=1396418 RepID=UPI000679AD64|nr:TIGR02677 family protein [Verrucomicrobium sp. BvORR034]
MEKPSQFLPEKGVESEDCDLYRVFQHLGTPKTSAYRIILRLFVAAKERFEIALRPGDLMIQLAELGEIAPELRDEEGLTSCLESLRDWGNLTATRDVVSAKSIEEYLHPKYMYQMSKAGELAERALAAYEDSLSRPGELSASALREIAETLDELLRLLEVAVPDESKVAKAMEDLVSRFDSLVARAQTFMGGLQREMDRPGGNETSFLGLKEELLRYLERFIKELLTATYRIRHSLEKFSDFQIEFALKSAVSREFAEVLSVDDHMRLRSLRSWQERWRGLKGWFIGRPDQPAQSERLRLRAVDSITALLERVRRMHDQRANRTDRSTDFLTLARWFAEAPDEITMHRLWRSAFALNSARHLRVNATTLQAWAKLDDGERPVWEEAPPYIITISQWSRGRSGQIGKPPKIVDRTAAREALRAKAHAEGLALQRSRQNLAKNTPCLLAELSELDAPAFEVLLDAISEAFANMKPEDVRGEATTADGEMNVTLELPASRQDIAHLRTHEGILTGPNIKITLRLTDEVTSPL